MKTTLAYSYFSSLTPKEVTLFGKYIRSPYFNEGKMHVKLFDQLKRIYEKDSASNKDVSKESVYNHVYGDKKFNRTKFNQLCSEMTKHIENFISLQESEKDKVSYYLKLLEGLERRQRFEEFDLVVNKINQIHNREVGAIADYYEMKTKIELMRHNSLSHRTETNDAERFSVLEKYSDLFVLEHKLYIGCSIMLERFLRPVKHPEKFEIIEILTRHVLKNRKEFRESNPVIYLQALFINVLLTHADKEIDQFESELGDLYDNLTFQEVNYFFEYCFVYLHSRALHKFVYNNKAFSFLSTFEKKGLFKKHSRIDREKFISYCYVSLNTNNAEWCMGFLNNYKHALFKGFRKQVESFILGLCYFEMKKFDDAVKELKSIKKTDKYIYSRTKTVLLMSYFESGDEDAAYNLVDNLKHYFRNNKVSEQNRFYLFLKYFLEYNKLISEKENAERVKDIIEEMKLIDQIAYKYWLMEKLNDLTSNKIKPSLQN